MQSANNSGIEPTTMPTKEGVEAAREWLEAHVFRVFLHEIRASPARYEAVLTAVATLTTRIAELEKGLRTCQEFILAHEKWEGEILLDNSLWQHGNDPFPHPGEAEVLQARRNYAKAEASRLLEGRQ